ncbi:HAD family hydrolase [Lentzea californiensis]|uniref:HAD family hydrolase n=1 Tax=Lentzea californiensis TaxID=438851 RepID=UPI002165175F|nr:HAD family phosphatase [Lentzea californiensis]MCR3752788.1 haloacid dehalogenase superfamily, subfamily IA, variant 3 with third motif having DD or ED [Lentzea californiensis]
MTLLATVFDLDETLVDSAATWNRVIGTVAARHDHRWTHADWTAIQGTSTWSAYLAERCRGLTPERAASECVDGMVDAIARGTFGLLPGAADLVALAAELGPVGLVSASPRRYVRAAASASGLRRHVEAIVTGDDVVNGKPAPDPYLLAARKLGLDPVNVLAVEDSASGIRSAHAAGMTVLAIPSAATARDSEVLELAACTASDARVAAKEICRLWVEVYALSR